MTRLDAASKLSQFRAELSLQGLNGFYVTRADRFQGEEVRPADEYLSYLTAFTGSAGIGLILEDVAGLFTDGRYRLQIAQQTDKNLYQTYDSADKNLAQWMAEQHGEGQIKLGYDSWTVTLAGLEKLPRKLGMAEVEWVSCPENPLRTIWQERPAHSATEIFILDEGIAGQNARQKQVEAAAELVEQGCSLAVITAVDSVNWLANIRARDLMHTPFHLCFAFLQDDGELVFIGDSTAAEAAGYKGLDWPQVPEYLNRYKGGVIACDPASLPVAMHDMLTRASLEIKSRPDPILAKKAIKNTQEISGFKEAHLRDGVALCRFWHWLETHGTEAGLSEAQIADKLSAFRAEDDSYICDSFATIAGFRDNGAIVHYRAIEGHDKQLDTDGVLLIDSGAHYKMGTTDITRTFYFGDASAIAPAPAIAQSSHVLAAHIELGRARFPTGVTGAQLDAICRAPLWAEGLDFGHGTGHGVGHILSVHEGPVSISKRCQLPVEAGMVLSNEPGYYVEGSHGIRHENLVLVTPQSDGFLGFETLTCFPFDARMLSPVLLSEAQKAWLNDYHSWVYAQLSPHLDPEIARWLKGKCVPV